MRNFPVIAECAAERGRSGKRVPGAGGFGVGQGQERQEVEALRELGDPTTPLRRAGAGCERPGGAAPGTQARGAGALFKASLGEWTEARRKRRAEGRTSGEPGFQYFLLNREPLAHGPASTRVTRDVSDGAGEGGSAAWGRGSGERQSLCRAGSLNAVIPGTRIHQRSEQMAQQEGLGKEIAARSLVTSV